LERLTAGSGRTPSPCCDGGALGPYSAFLRRPDPARDRELGYLPLPAEAASALFQVVSHRYLKTSIVITTNRGVGVWGEILGDTTVAAAMLDRLLHRSVVINLDGEFYRLRDHQAAAETPRRTTTGARQQLHPSNGAAGWQFNVLRCQVVAGRASSKHVRQKQLDYK